MLQIEITFDFCFQEHFWDEQPDVKSNHAIVITIIHHDWIEEIQQFAGQWNWQIISEFDKLFWAMLMEAQPSSSLYDDNDKQKTKSRLGGRNTEMT